MNNIRITCKSCNVELTDILTLVSESKIIWSEEGNILKSNECAFLEHNNKISLVTNLVDYYLLNHPDPTRFYGCCGSSGSEMNKICKNGHEVAIEFSDCWTSHYLEFNLEKVKVEEVIN
ncbi:hypothetical protein [Chryseobacterium sp. FH1]|uniref:hypothetical protein n=1 Tax=Chryseobacterium sp. FH1 TaxID=1233951 RepID=UPI00068FD6C5|nr:hypothetical protein [Chryseobacterium sp. FH1]